MIKAQTFPPELTTFQPENLARRLLLVLVAFADVAGPERIETFCVRHYAEEKGQAGAAVQTLHGGACGFWIKNSR